MTAERTNEHPIFCERKIKCFIEKNQFDEVDLGIIEKLASFDKNDLFLFA